MKNIMSCFFLMCEKILYEQYIFSSVKQVFISVKKKRWSKSEYKKTIDYDSL
jgi:hypothetical protein